MTYTCGIDEAGRGPLAGPVTAAAVILGSDFPADLLADSKALSASRRESLRAIITQKALAWALGWSSHREIDRINIHRATLLAMQRAFRGIALVADRAMVDGRFCPELGVRCTPVVHGDQFVPEIQAASILAKTCRDAWMIAYGKIEPQYSFEQHKGYPTMDHKLRIARFGPSAIQRLSFNAAPSTWQNPCPCESLEGRAGFVDVE